MQVSGQPEQQLTTSAGLIHPRRDWPAHSCSYTGHGCLDPSRKVERFRQGAHILYKEFAVEAAEALARHSPALRDWMGHMLIRHKRSIPSGDGVRLPRDVIGCHDDSRGVFFHPASIASPWRKVHRCCRIRMWIKSGAITSFRSAACRK